MKRGLLLSGGIDSAAVAWWKRPDIAYTIDYGHSAAAAEIRVARKICEIMKCQHKVFKVDAVHLGAGPLAKKAASDLSPHREWWPFRNQFLLTVAGMHAVQHGLHELLIGSVRGDSRHADGKRIFVERIDQLMARQEGGLRVVAPALSYSTVQLISKSKIPAAILLATHSCHSGNAHCCACPGCNKRLAVFAAIGLTDL